MNLLQRILAAVRGQRPGEPRVYISSRQAGVTVNEDTAMTLPEWWACVSVITRAVAGLPWGVYERTEEGRRPIKGTVEWLLNNQPNPEMTAFSLREAMGAHALNWGNGYAEIVRDLAGRPAELWLLAPDRTWPERDEAGALRYKCMGENGEVTYLEPSQVLHLHGLGFDGLTGYSVARLAARSIGIGIAQDTFTQAFYANGTMFGAQVEVPSTMREDQIQATEKYLNGKHGGPANAFRVRILPPGSKATSFGMSMDDAQFIESRGLSVTTAARWLGVPPHKIADLSRSTNNNIEHQGIEFVTDAIVPWAQRLEQEVNCKLIGARQQGRVYTKLSVNALMRGDSKTRAEFYRTMTQIGAMTINEVRALEDMNGIGPAGDELLVQLNQTTLGRLVNDPPPQSAPAAGQATTPAQADPQADPQQGPPAEPSNVIRSAALAYLRQQRNTA